MNLRFFFLLSLGLASSTVSSGFYKDNTGLPTELVALMGLAYFSSNYDPVAILPEAEPKAAPGADFLKQYQDDTEVIRLHWDGTVPALTFCATAALTIQELAITVPPSNEIRIIQDKGCLVVQSNSNRGSTTLRITELESGDFQSNRLGSLLSADISVIVSPMLFPELPPDPIYRTVRLEVHPELWKNLSINPRYQDLLLTTHPVRQAGNGGKQKSDSGSSGAGAGKSDTSAGKSKKKEAASGGGGAGASSSGAGGGDDDDLIRKIQFQMLLGGVVPPPLGYQVMMLVIKLMVVISESGDAERSRLLRKFYGLDCVNKTFPSSFMRICELNHEQLERTIKSLSSLQQQLILETFSDEKRVQDHSLRNPEKLQYFSLGLKARFM